jgi:hypothetical protein
MTPSDHPTPTDDPSAATQPAASELPPAYSFTEDQLYRFLEDKWKQFVCEMCLQPQSFSLTGQSSRFTAFPALGDAQPVTTFVTSAHVGVNIFCRNCGNMKFILAPTIHRWLRDNPVPASSNE